MHLTGKERTVLRGVVESLKHSFHAEQVVLFGSAARGELNEGSDVDLFVVLPTVDWPTEKKICDVCYDAELETGRVFSTICVSADEMRNAPVRYSPLVAHVQCEGLPL